jgi:hypothetical protein
MKYRKLLLLKQKGQTLVEFVLLLAVVSGISYTFVAFMNRNITRYWEHAANLIINDGVAPKPGNTRLKVR